MHKEKQSVTGNDYQPWGEQAELLSKTEIIDQKITGEVEYFKPTQATVKAIEEGTDKRQLVALVKLVDMDEKVLGKFWVDGTLVSEVVGNETVAYNNFSGSINHHNLDNIKKID